MRALRRRQPIITEEHEEVPTSGDSPFAPGTARAALAHREFRIVWSGSFASNIGKWMQNVILGAYAYELTGSALFVSLIYVAQLGPMLLLSIVGGALADLVDRRRLLLIAQVEQAAASVVLAVLVLAGDPPQVALLAVVAAIGIGNAINAPAYTAVLPLLVGRRDMAGAIALNSTQMNASRVIGPALGGLALPLIGAAGVFFVNAATYAFVIAALLVIRLPATEPDPTGAKGWRRLVAGLTIARRGPLVRRCLITMSVFSLLCLPFIGQLPTLAARNLGMDVESTAYGLLYSCFGLGGVMGAISVGTFLSRFDRMRTVRGGLLAFAVALTTFALLRSPWPAYPVVAVVGFCYMSTVVSLSTILQEHIPDSVRGRVMALWIMAFGGTVPIGLLIAGPLIELTSVTAVVLYGAVAAVGLAWYADLRSAAEQPASQALAAGL
ncbi:MAG TPA: MFS transporter [Acidimicrobiales bacterium]|nr:MFS transporter [Acidimicrobiales bacterium]